MPEQEKKQDILDVALSELVDDVVGDVDEGAIDDATSALFDVIANLVDENKIEDVPPEDATDDEKKAWLDKSLPIIKSEMETELGSDEEGEMDFSEPDQE